MKKGPPEDLPKPDEKEDCHSLCSSNILLFSECLSYEHFSVCTELKDAGSLFKCDDEFCDETCGQTFCRLENDDKSVCI